MGRGIKLKTIHWALGVTQAFLRLFFLRFSFFSLLWLRLNNVSSHLSYFSAGPTIAVICAVEHRHPATHARITHNRQTLCRPRPLNSSQKPNLSTSIATNGTMVQAEPLPDCYKCRCRCRCRITHSHGSNSNDSTWSWPCAILVAFNFVFLQITQGKNNDNSWTFFSTYLTDAQWHQGRCCRWRCIQHPPRSYRVVVWLVSWSI